MSPTLFTFDLGGRELGLPTYGVLVALGFAVGIVLFFREGKRQGLDGARLLDLAFWGVVAGLVGSRLAFVGLNAGEFIDACFNPRGAGAFAGASSELSARIAGCTAALRFWDGGFVFYGGALAAGRWWRAVLPARGLVFLAHRRSGGAHAGHRRTPSAGWAASSRVAVLARACQAPGECLSPRGAWLSTSCSRSGVLAPAAMLTPPLHATQLYEAAGELIALPAVAGVAPALAPTIRRPPNASPVAGGAPSDRRAGCCSSTSGGMPSCACSWRCSEGTSRGASWWNGPARSRRRVGPAARRAAVPLGFAVHQRVDAGSHRGDGAVAAQAAHPLTPDPRGGACAWRPGTAPGKRAPSPRSLPIQRRGPNRRRCPRRPTATSPAPRTVAVRMATARSRSPAAPSHPVAPV